ncbi:MAG: histidine phosphatase family protein [Chloroflexi bacterium]|nr:histidine phosphatase family protein [Chloroflexota bacterium]
MPRSIHPLRDDLREADFDVGTAMPRFDLPADALSAANIAPETRGADYLQFQTRVVAAFRAIVRAHREGTILVVTHGGVIATLLRSIFSGHQVSMYSDNTALTMLQWRNARWYLEFSNRREHLVK